MAKHAILYDACNVKLQMYEKVLAWSQRGGGEKHLKNFFKFLYVEKQKQSFQSIFLNRYLSKETGLFVDNSSKIIQTNACQNKTVLGVWIAYILMESGNAAVFTKLKKHFLYD